MSKQKKNKPKHQDPISRDIAALERAALKLATYYDTRTIHGLINCILQGWIHEGQFTDEYRRLARDAEAARAESLAAQQRLAAFRATLPETRSATGGVTSDR